MSAKQRFWQAARFEQREAQKIVEKQEAKESEGAAQYYRSKQQRSEDAKRKRRIKELEDNIAALEEQIDTLEAEIADPATSADFQLLQEKCLLLEQTKDQLSECMDQWLELSEGWSYRKGDNPWKSIGTINTTPYRYTHFWPVLPLLLPLSPSANSLSSADLSAG